MSEQVIVPKADWQGILDAVRYGTEKNELLRSGEVAGELMDLSSRFDGLVDGSAESFKNSRLTSIRQFAFMRSQNMKSVVLPNVTSVPMQAFAQCTSLERADFSNITSIESYAFNGATVLETLIIRTNAVCDIANRMVFQGTRIYTGEGYIYVPAALLDEYKQATNWTTLADNIRAIEDYPEITGETI